ncbi:MAG TPA: type IX secretion system membrane protein PorP/SprF [Bacteroidales bacterium]|nr:type IX secretion system membrane protein PorP/SprF [Bacteroidales bacterium]HSA42871.1 type IX secretion system membrane protein PorP/SprF [Bacteroidales bacterium]
MKTITLIIVLQLIAFVVPAQQVPLTSQYMMNQYILNPAVAGTESFIPINLNIRNQWLNLEGAPVTQTLSSHAWLGKNIGIGGCFFNDVTGPTRRTGMSMSLAYHLRLNKDFTRMLSFGLGGVFFQRYVDIDKLTTAEPEDMSILNGFNNQLGQDANFGMLYSDYGKYHVGFSVLNLLESKKDLYNVSDEIKNPVSRAYYLHGAYYFDLGRLYGLEPSFLLQRQENTPIQVDLNLRFTYNKMFWFGGSYRMQDAFVLMFALDMKDFAIGYSYDLTMSEIRKHSQGSHEVNFIYRIFRKNAFNRLNTNKPHPLFS